MALRVLAALILTGALVLTFGSGSVSAHGPKLRGTQLVSNAQFTDTTGNCKCNWRYYTVGLNRGHVTITVMMNRVSGTIAPAYGIRVFLQQASNGNTLKSLPAGCASHQKGCRAGVMLTYNITRAGVYYILVLGEGAMSIHYSLQLRGNVYALHCAEYC